MRSALLPLATRLVRAWTRVYTHGLPQAERTARRAEIDSDLWEFEHDPQAPRGGWAATQVLARLLLGIPDDLAWRMDVGATRHCAPVRALAAAGMMTGPRRVSAFGLFGDHSRRRHFRRDVADLAWIGALAESG